MRGWWNMPCWNGLSPAQQEFVRTRGYLEIGYVEAGECKNGAELEITTMYDQFPGPRFYCCDCAIKYLDEVGFDAIQEPRTLSDERESRPGRIGH